MISVLVPTYCRVADLDRCLAGLAAQTRPADEIIVIARESDAPTQEYLRTRRDAMPGLRVVTVTVPGVIAAMNAGLDVAGGDLIALTDDDAAPHADWLARLEAHFAADPRLGGVGGRDYQFKNGVEDLGRVDSAGEMSWYGRVTAGHHYVVGPAREVAVVKGVNCAYRAGPVRAIGFDRRLAGTGAQVHWELSLGLALRRAGWKVVLDPSIGVDHFPAERFDEDQRKGFSSLAQRNAVANETLILLEHLRGPARAAFVCWALLIGTRASPGIAQVGRLLLMRQTNVLRRWGATLCGRAAGFGMYAAGPRAAVPASPPARVTAAAVVPWGGRP